MNDFALMVSVVGGLLVAVFIWGGVAWKMPAEAKAQGWMDELVETIKERSKSWPEDLRSQLEAGLQNIRQEPTAKEKAEEANQ